MTKSTSNIPTDPFAKYPAFLNTFDKIQMYLFEEEKNIPKHHKLTTKEEKLRKIYSAVFTYWLDKPTLSDKKVCNYIVDEFGISKHYSFKYLYAVKVLLGNVHNANKQWQRYKVIAMLDRAYEIAERRQDAKAIILAADRLGKYTQLDKEDTLKIPYDEIVPQNWEISDDVTILGLNPIEDLEAKQKEMRIKYGSTAIEDAQILNETEQ